MGQLAKVRLLKHFIDGDVKVIKDNLEKAIDRNYGLIIEVCEEGGLNKAEYLNYFRKRLEEEIYDRKNKK